MIEFIRKKIQNYPKFRKFLISIKLNLQNPERIKRLIRIYINLPRTKKRKILFYAPNYIFVDRLNKTSVIIDVGCGFDADFSKLLIKKYGLFSYAVDPTQKQKTLLQGIEKKLINNFKYLNMAVSVDDGFITFNESRINESGSILQDHVNIKKDEIVTYQVESKSIDGLLKYINQTRIDLIKLDLEGAEYDLISKLAASEIEKFDQIFVEFHHHAVDKYSLNDTRIAVKSLEEKGFKSFTLDGHNFLFYKEQ